MTQQARIREWAAEWDAQGCDVWLTDGAFCSVPVPGLCLLDPRARPDFDFVATLERQLYSGLTTKVTQL